MSAQTGASDRSDGLTPTGRVPVEHRFFGSDRRSLLPGLVVLALFVLWTVVVPSVNDLLRYSQQTKAGDVFVLERGLTMDARPGWGVDSGLLTTDRTRRAAAGESVALSNGGVSFAVTTAPFRGDARELLGRIRRVDHGCAGAPARGARSHRMGPAVPLPAAAQPVLLAVRRVRCVGALHLVRFFGGGAHVVAAGLGAGAAATALYGLVFLAILRLGDHYERQPRNLVFTAFVWGAIPATFLFALTANTAMLAISPSSSDRPSPPTGPRR